MSKEQEVINNNGALNAEPSKEKRIGCAHYKRRAKFVTPCCNKVYVCRYCHDENEQHYFNRKSVTELICTECDKRQKVQEVCENCGVRFGKYNKIENCNERQLDLVLCTRSVGEEVEVRAAEPHVPPDPNHPLLTVAVPQRRRVCGQCGECHGVASGPAPPLPPEGEGSVQAHTGEHSYKYTCLICNLFDDDDKRQYHCDGCGICRVGGRDRFFHCERCNMCLPVQLQQVGHRCVENVSRSNCPVCLEDIHTSRIPCHIPDCGHLLHRPCFEQMLHSGHYACPTCQTSMIDMTNLWSYLDSEVAATPMPPEYADYKATILCKDCHKLSTVKFHVVGLKCQHCGAYNTCQTNGFHKDSKSSETGDSSSSTSTSTSRSGSGSAVNAASVAGAGGGAARPDDPASSGAASPDAPRSPREPRADLPRASPLDEPPQA